MHRRSTLGLGALVALVAAQLIFLAGPAAALNVVTVTTTTDGGPGSLRAAFDTANTDGDDTEIVLAAGETYVLDICADDDTNVGGDLDHTSTDALTITGNGATIEQTCTGRRVIDNDASGAISLSDVTITGGTEDDDGGGLSSEDGGDVTITSSTFTENSSDEDGGAVAVDDGADLTVTGSTFTDNDAAEDGGAIHDDDTNGGTLDIDSSTFARNSALFSGGAVYNGELGTATVSFTVFDDNEAIGDAGAFDNGAGTRTTITHSSFVGNESAQEGAAIENDSAFQDVPGGDLDLVNSTFSDNAAPGGVIDVGVGAETDLVNVTVTANETEIGALTTLNPDEADGTLRLFNTIVANQVSGGDCALSEGITSLGYNIDSDDTCNLTAAGDQPSTDPVLGALADNGGPTRTHLPQTGSPAIDTGGNDGCPADDQRTITRPQNATGLPEAICDIGAVEVEAPPPPTTTTTTQPPTTQPATTPLAPVTPVTPTARAVPLEPTITG